MTRSPLASIYSTSTMENHHFNMTINILQQVLTDPSNPTRSIITSSPN